MPNTVYASGIKPSTSEKSVRDFFTFCGKITDLSLSPASGGEDSTGTRTATVHFEKETAAKTALLLHGADLDGSTLHVASEPPSGHPHHGEPQQAAAGGYQPSHTAKEEESISQEDKPRSRIAAEYLAHGYTLSDQMIQQAIALDNKHGFSNRFTSALSNFDNKYKATDKARSVDASYGVTDKALGAWSGLNSYFEKALGTPTGQRVLDFYAQTNKQVQDIHKEARRLADLKSGKTPSTAGVPGAAAGEHEPHHVAGTQKTVCSCGGAEGVCGCAPGECACESCGKSDQAAVTEFKEAQQAAHEGPAKV